MNDTLAKLIPSLATAFLGPVGGALTAFVASKLGVSPSDTATLADTIAGLSPEKRIELEQVANQFAVTEYNKITLALMQDVQTARARDVEITKSGGHNYRADTMFVLAVCLVAGMIYIVWSDDTLNEYAKGIFTLALGRFLGYLDNIYNFEFGTTRSSKAKDETISNLSKTGE